MNAPRRRSLAPSTLAPISPDEAKRREERLAQLIQEGRERRAGLRPVTHQDYCGPCFAGSHDGCRNTYPEMTAPLCRCGERAHQPQPFLT